MKFIVTNINKYVTFFADLKKLQAWVRLKQKHKTFDEIIGIAKEKIMNDNFFNRKRNEGATFKTVVSFFSDPYHLHVLLTKA